MTCIVYFGELRQQSSHRRWNRRQTERCFSGNTECPFRANEQSQQIVTRQLSAAAAKFHHFSTGKHYLQTKHMICGRAIFQAVNAARVFRNVSADGASGLTGWIGNVMQTEMRDRVRNVEVDNAGLNYGKVIDRIDFEYLTHARQLDDDSLLHCQRAAG